jgi:hypothetical protein
MSAKDYSGTPLGKKLGARPGVEVLVLFTTSRAEVESRFAALKKASKIETDLSFEVVRQVGLARGLVDNKSAAIDESRQALRFVYRREDRPGS